MREVVIKLTGQKDLVKHQSSAMTFGDLKKELKQIKWSGMRVVERSTKATLQLADAVLPQGDFILFLVPEKVKSGMVKTSGGVETLDDIEGANYNQLRSHMSWLNRNEAANFDMSGGTEDLRKRLLKYKGKSPSKAKAKAPAAKKPATKAPAAKAEKVAEYKPTARMDDEDDEDYEDRIAFEKKAFDKKAKKAAEKKAEEEKLEKERLEKEEKEKAEKAKKAEAPAKKKGGLFSKKPKAEAVPETPVDVLESCRENINQTIDKLVQEALSGGGGVQSEILQYNVKDLDKEIEKIRQALSGGKYTKV